MESSFEEMNEIYGGLPLKHDFMECGRKALAEKNAPEFCKPEMKDGMLCFRVIYCPYYTEETFMEECRKCMSYDMSFEEAVELCRPDRHAYKEVVMNIDINRDDEEISVGTIDADFGIYRDTNGEQEYIDYLDDDWYLSDEEVEQIVGLTEVFLNEAVDVDRM